jgi:adenosylcobinamide-GDP ribazoletransferase
LKYIKRFLLLVSFMTTIPVGKGMEADNEDFGKGLAFAPLVGLVMGIILAAAGWLLGLLFPPAVTAVLVFIIYLLLTGGLHMDGLGDTFDGVYSGRPRERILEIMRDSRIGTNALLAVVSVIILDMVLLVGANEKILLLFPVAGRIGSLTAAAVSTYARSGEGLGRSFIEYCGKPQLALGLVIYFVIFLGVMGPIGLAAAVIPPVSAYLLVRLLSRKIGGATGDILGAVCEINQAVFLLEAYVIKHIFLG